VELEHARGTQTEIVQHLGAICRSLASSLTSESCGTLSVGSWANQNCFAGMFWGTWSLYVLPA
jgi:hypothetical protein